LRSRPCRPRWTPLKQRWSRAPVSRLLLRSTPVAGMLRPFEHRAWAFALPRRSARHSASQDRRPFRPGGPRAARAATLRSRSTSRSGAPASARWSTCCCTRRRRSCRARSSTGRRGARRPAALPPASRRPPAPRQASGAGPQECAGITCLRAPLLFLCWHPACWRPCKSLNVATEAFHRDCSHCMGWRQRQQRGRLLRRSCALWARGGHCRA